jgi:GNAT superfamily N-acetyltransferase
MNIDELRQIYDREQRRDVQYVDTRREATAQVVRHIQTAGRQQGWVLWSDLNEDNVEDAITAQIDYFESIGYNFEWTVNEHDTPADLKQRLLNRGFVPRYPDEDAIMVLDLEAHPGLLNQSVPDSIRRLTQPEEIAGLVELLNAVWDEDLTPLGEDLARQLRHTPEAISIYAAFDGDRVVSGAWTQFTPDNRFASLWGGSTLPAYRKQGLYTGLLATRAGEAHERGKRFLRVDAAPMSRPILEKLGFVCITMASACMWTVDAS